MTPSPKTRKGRPTKFTPERIQQIKTLVERGTTREQIAEILNVTVGSLQVTCSRLGISLRRPIFASGPELQRRDSRHGTEPASVGLSSVALSLAQKATDQTDPNEAGAREQPKQSSRSAGGRQATTQTR